MCCIFLLYPLKSQKLSVQERKVVETEKARTRR